MAVPDFQSFMLPLLKLTADGDEEPPAAFDHAAAAWVLREGVEERIREKLERSIPKEETRRAALALLAFAVENADEERGDAWFIKETSHGLALMAGRLLACKVTRSKAKLSVIGPITEEVRAAVGAEPEDDDEFRLDSGQSPSQDRHRRTS
jgi:hypothetical protein